jgi:Acyl-CoA dehydrogenase, N-terminal domain
MLGKLEFKMKSQIEKESNRIASENRSSGNSGSPDAINMCASLPRPVECVLTEEMLTRFASRAASYDQENRFFEEDFEELRKAKYLLLPLPPEFGGAGMTLTEVCREQRRLAYHAPATALAVNMHLYWIGVAADLRRRGDVSLDWILREAAAGEIFAAGHAESGNDAGSALDCESRTCRRRLQIHRNETLWQPDARVDAVWLAWDGHQQP